MTIDANGGEQPGEQPGEPRPRRNLIGRIFRSHDFARDLVVTTLGVLIALGIGEIVEEVRWKFRIAANDKAMKTEAGLLRGVYIERDMLEPCIARRLTELREVLSDARSAARLPDVRNVAAPPNHAKFGDSWEMMLGTEIPLHIDPRELMGTATIWVNEDAYSNMVDRQRDAFDRLRLIEGRPGPANESLLLELEKQLSEAEIASDATLFIARQDTRVLDEFGVKALYRPDIAFDRKLMGQELRKRYLCAPLQVDGKAYRLKGPLRQPRRSSAPDPA